MRRAPLGCVRGKTTKRLTYICKGCHGINIRAEHVEPMLLEIVGGRLAMADAVDLLKAEHTTPTRPRRYAPQANSLLIRIGRHRRGTRRRPADRQASEIATERINAKLAAIERRQQDQERLRVFQDLPLGTPEVVDAVRALSPDRFRAVVDVLMTVTVAPVGKSGRSVQSGTGTGELAMSEHPDFLIVCDHGARGGRLDPVARFQWGQYGWELPLQFTAAALGR